MPNKTFTLVMATDGEAFRKNRADEVATILENVAAEIRKRGAKRPINNAYFKDSHRVPNCRVNWT